MKTKVNEAIELVLFDATAQKAKNIYIHIYI